MNKKGCTDKNENLLNFTTTYVINVSQHLTLQLTFTNNINV